ncbi:NhaP-type Na+/H+ or K+/H+ antiporter [Paenibacillus sp. 4624]
MEIFFKPQESILHKAIIYFVVSVLGGAVGGFIGGMVGIWFLP